MSYIIRSLCLAALLSLIFAASVLAQPGTQGIDYDSWERTASRAEEAIDAGRASTIALEQLRNQLVEWRQRFSSAQGTNSELIQTVRNQLDSLGSAPEDGNEAAEIAAQRTELNTRLANLQAPAKSAEVAHSRANGLISAIDSIIQERQTQELLSLGPSPLNPAHWPAGATALFDNAKSVRDEVATAWENPAQKSRTKENLPVAALLALFGVVMVAGARRWSDRLMRRVLDRSGTTHGWLASVGISLGDLFLPFLGVVVLVEATYMTELVGLRGDLLLSEIIPAVFFFLAARWLVWRIFPRDEDYVLPLMLTDAERLTGRRYGALLGFVIAAFYYLESVSRINQWTPEAANVVLFPVLVIAALLLFRLARLLLAHCLAVARDADTDETFRNRLARLMARMLMALAIVAPALGALGYFDLAKAMMLPSLLSLLLLGGLLVLQRLSTEIYVLVVGNREDAETSLVPVLAGFFLVLLSLPLFALAWGARVAQLTDLWIRFVDGIYLGNVRISPTIFLTLAIVFVVGYFLTRLLQGTLRNTVLPKTRIDTGGRNALVSGVGYIGIFLSAIIAITSAGIDLSSLAIVAGALSVGIGFGLQNIVSNFVSGIILLIERPISEGDWIEVGGQHGVVRSISVRSTRIETFDRTDMIVPNADFVSGTVTNYTRGNTVGRVIVPVGVAYGTDTRKVEKILQEVGEAHPMVLMNPPPYVVFQGFGASSMDFEIRAILRDVNWILNVKSDMNHEIARRFAEEGVEIPYAQRDIWIRNPEALSGAGSRADDPRPAPEASPEPDEVTEPPAKQHITADDLDADGNDGDT